MLKQEVDYLKEKKFQEQYAKILESDKRFYVPAIINELSSRNVLCSEYIAGEIPGALFFQKKGISEQKIAKIM